MINDNRLIILEQLLKDKPEIGDLFYQVITEAAEVKRRKLLTSLIILVIDHVEYEVISFD